MQLAQQSQPEQLTDTELIQRLVRRGLEETSDFGAFWGYFVAALTSHLEQTPDMEPYLSAKTKLAAYFIQILLRNFYQGPPLGFYWKAGALRQKVFRLALEFGLHILPAHFYSPVPDIRKLPHDIWARASELPGIKPNLEKQLELLFHFGQRFREEYEAIPLQRPPASPPYGYYAQNGYYDSVDGYTLYCMIRYFKPRRIIEIGSGNSTLLSAQAIACNTQSDPSCRCELTAIEPYPNEVLQAGFPGLTRLIQRPIQQVPLSEFQTLKKNDILFIDSSHVLAIGSDVQYEILEVLPRLNPGVLVHFHDIFTPLEYPRDWVQEMNRYWTEQYVLQAFLAFNESFEILLAPVYLRVHCPESLEQAFQNYRRDQEWLPANFWIRRTQ